MCYSMECYWETFPWKSQITLSTEKQVSLSKVKTLMYVWLREHGAAFHSDDLWLIFLSNYGNLSVYKMLFIFFVRVQHKITSHDFFFFAIANFRNSKSLRMMKGDIPVLRQLLSNTALLFHNQTALPTHCSEMYVISWWLEFQLFFRVSLRSQRKWNNKSWKE